MSAKSFLEQLLEQTDKIEAVDPISTIKVPTQKDKKAEWLESIDLLDNNNREAFIKAVYGSCDTAGGEYGIKINEPAAGVNYNSFATIPSVNLITVCGRFSNLIFEEEEMIKYIEPTADVPGIRCNYGEKNYGDFVYPVEKVKKSNRGRKKKVKPEKKRKIQGTGKYFNSQISFIIPYYLPPDLLETKKFQNLKPLVAGEPVLSPKPFKLKVFRTGVITLADVKQQTLEIAIDILKKVAVLFNTAISKAASAGITINKYVDNTIIPGTAGVNNSVDLISLVPIMKNYEFTILIKEKEYLDLEAIVDVFNEEIRGELSTNTKFSIKEANHPKNSTKISIKFKTPNISKPQKTLRVNMFQANKKNNKLKLLDCIKINALGGLEDKNINNVFFTICNAFRKYKSKIILEYDD